MAAVWRQSVKAETSKQIKQKNHGCMTEDTVSMWTCKIRTDNGIVHSYSDKLYVSSRERP